MFHDLLVGCWVTRIQIMLVFPMLQTLTTLLKESTAIWTLIWIFRYLIRVIVIRILQTKHVIGTIIDHFSSIFSMCKGATTAFNVLQNIRIGSEITFATEGA